MSRILNILNVAEKPSVAKEISRVLSLNSCTSEQSLSKYNPVYSFKYEFNHKNKYVRQDSLMYFTSVTGHIMNFEFDIKYKSWKGYESIELLNTAPVY